MEDVSQTSALNDDGRAPAHSTNSSQEGVVWLRLEQGVFIDDFFPAWRSLFFCLLPLLTPRAETSQSPRAEPKGAIIHNKRYYYKRQIRQGKKKGKRRQNCSSSSDASAHVPSPPSFVLLARNVSLACSAAAVRSATTRVFFASTAATAAAVAYTPPPSPLHTSWRVTHETILTA